MYIHIYTHIYIPFHPWAGARPGASAASDYEPERPRVRKIY